MTKASDLSVFLIAASLDAARGGQERSVAEYVAALQAMGVTTELWPGDDSGDHFPPPGNTREWLDAAERAARDATDRGMVVQSMLPVCAAQFYVPRGGVYPEAYARSAASRPTAFGRWVAGLTNSSGATRKELLRRERRCLANDDGPTLVALSGYVADTARRHYDLSPSRIRVVPNGVALDRLPLHGDKEAARSALDIGDDQVLFVAGATNHRLKGIASLLKAMKDLCEQGEIRLVIAGGEPSPMSDSRVRFLGSVNDIVPVMRAADVVVHPTFYDPSSRIVLEGLALGVPAITTSFNGAADYLSDGAGLVLDDPRNVGALAMMMQTMADPQVREAMGAKALALRDSVSMKRHTEDMAKLFRGTVR